MDKRRLEKIENSLKDLEERMLAEEDDREMKPAFVGWCAKSSAPTFLLLITNIILFIGFITMVLITVLDYE